MKRLSLILLFLVGPTFAQTAQERLAEVQQKLRRADAATIDALLTQAGKDPDAAIRRAILDRLGRLDNPKVREALERHAAGDPDAGVALLALERLRILKARELEQLFQKRLELALSQKDEEAARGLIAAHQRWVSYARGAVLPEFLQQAPPVFEAVSKPRVRVVVIADFGRQGDNQREIAARVAAAHRSKPFDLGLTLGDNFTDPDGVTGPEDPRWQPGWEQLYQSLGIPFFPVTGNHDWSPAESPASQILRSQKGSSWRMPALYYSFLAGPAQFFALATHAFSQTQVAWVQQELERSRAGWKILYGHHPIYSYGVHGDTPELQRLLLPVLKGRAHVYLAGHDHLPQHLKPEGGVHFFVAPAAGQSSRPERSGPLTLFSGSFYGFMTLEIDAEQLKVAFADISGATRYETTLRR